MTPDQDAGTEAAGRFTEADRETAERAIAFFEASHWHGHAAAIRASLDEIDRLKLALAGQPDPIFAGSLREQIQSEMIVLMGQAIDRLEAERDEAIAARESYVEAMGRFKANVVADHVEARDDLGRAIGFKFGDGIMIDEVAQMAVGYVEARHKEIEKLEAEVERLRVVEAERDALARWSAGRLASFGQWLGNAPITADGVLSLARQAAGGPDT